MKNQTDNIQKEPDVSHANYESINIIRMTPEDRQSLNRIIQHKREEFESVIQKGVVAMLNAQEEHQKLAAERAEFLGFLSNRNKQKKEKITQYTQVAKDATQSAPMGFGVAANLTLETANVIGNKLYDGFEEQRQREEAEQSLYSAQMLYYIPPQNYEIISQRVASILSYRYQFLILRLDAGENGYMKLANFFVSSMKTYAISRLREHKTDVVRALINSAIPPSSDSLSYRDWPSVDFANFRTHFSQFGTRKTLHLDRDVNRILNRCGPAVRGLLGGLDSYIVHSTGKKYAYKPYTILGALNHAPILNPNKQIITGLQTKHREDISLNGNSKYPLILIGLGETTADLGVNFATKTTNEVLEDAHIEVLRRLVPDFFEHEVIYHLNAIKQKAEASANDARNQEEKVEGLLTVKRQKEKAQPFANDLRYQEEKFECPWTAKRQMEYESRLQAILPLMSPSKQIHEEECFDESINFLLMQSATQEFNLEYKKNDAIKINEQTLKIIRQNFQSNNQGMDELYLSKYAAYAVKEWLFCMNESQIYKKEDLEMARQIIETANLAIFASRGHPLYETEKLDRLLKIRQNFLTFNDYFFHLNQTISIYYFLLLAQIEDLQSFEIGNELISRENLAVIRNNKTNKAQIDTSMKYILKMKEVSQAIASYHGLDEIPDVQLEAFYDELKNIQNSLHTSPSNTPLESLNHIELCSIETKCYVEYLKIIFGSNRVKIEGKLNSEVVKELNELLKISENFFAEAKVIYQEQPWFSNLKKQQLDKLLAIKDTIIINRDNVLDIKSKIIFLSDFNCLAYFLRASVQAEFKILQYLASLDKGYTQAQFERLYTLAKHLHIQLKTLHASKVDEVYIHIKEKNLSKYSRDTDLITLRNKSRTIRQEIDKLELEVRDDSEIFDIVMNQLQLSFREADQILLNLNDVEAKIKYIQTNLHPISKNSSENSLSFELNNEQYIGKIKLKLDALKEFHPFLKASIVHDKILSAFAIFKEQKTNDNEFDIRYLFIKFLIDNIQEIYDCTRHEIKFNEKIQELRIELGKATNIVNSEPQEIRNARKKSLKILKQSFQMMVKANQSQKQLSKPSSNWKFSSDTLRWAQHLNVSEQKWLDGKQDRKALLKSEQSREQKSPTRMAFSFILAVINDQLSNKKFERHRLKKIELGALTTKLMPLSMDTSETTKEKKFIEKKNSLLKVTRQKIKTLDEEIEDLDILKQQMIRSTLKIFFLDWKTKTCPNIEVHTKKIKPPLQSQEIKSSEIHSEVKVEEDERQYSVEELERWLDFLQKSFCETECEISFKTSRNGTLSKDSSLNALPESDANSSEEIFTASAMSPGNR